MTSATAGVSDESSLVARLSLEQKVRLLTGADAWTLTHKSKGTIGLHKSRVETETAVAEGAAGGEASEAASDDCHGGLGSGHQRLRFRNPLLRMVSFSRSVRLTLRVKTS